MKVSRFYAVDGLRGMFSVAVLLNHAINSVSGWKNDGPFSGPHLAVAYFFIISGFVLTHSTRNGVSIRVYFMTRLARLWPLTIISSTMMIVIFYINSINNGYVPGDYVFDVRTWIKNAMFIHGVTPLNFPIINGPAWSVSIEFWASLLVPIVFLKVGAFFRLIISIFIFIFLAITSKVGLGSNELFGMYNFVFASSCLLLGSACYTLIKSNWVSSLIKLPYKDVFLAVSLFVCIVGLYAQPAHTNRMDYFYLVSFLPLLTIDYMDDNSLIKKIIYSSPIQFFGYISFPLYLLHFPVMITGIVEGNPIVGIVSFVSVSVLLSYLYAAFVDVRMYQYLKGLINIFFSAKKIATQDTKQQLK
ncbi:Acyltransferase family [Yersinia frederiksenii]|uniref:acyltransferase family protein n=1 Tax=Yersinia frederiksenii TaxID=29484 RepID=UPI0005DD9AE8|nr:acyltransferase [Yersinia frederiksenii]CNC24406.1 Acyltransferase family [Yersinia frederiksenii]